jgi:hypothetical protein
MHDSTHRDNTTKTNPQNYLLVLFHTTKTTTTVHRHDNQPPTHAPSEEEVAALPYVGIGIVQDPQERLQPVFDEDGAVVVSCDVGGVGGGGMDVCVCVCV